MLYVFLVDSGKMLTFDVNYAFKPFVKNAIWEDCGIPEDKQVLIVSGGECLDVNAKICTYSAGTDTNPIFLFNKLYIDNPLSMYSKMDNGIDIMLKEQVEGSLLLLPSYSTIVARTQLAQQLKEASRKELTACEKTVHDQHVMQQAWAAVTANLEDAIRAFELRAATMFSHYGAAYLLGTRPRYVALVRRLPADCEILAGLPFLLPPPDPEVSCEGGPRIDPTPATLLDWIKSKDKNGDLLELVETCGKELEKYNESLLHEMRAEFAVAFDAATRNQAMKEIRGLEDRLYGLEQLLFEARSSLDQQTELTQGFMQNQHRAGKENDSSIFPDLCSSHKRQLLYMLKNYHHIKEISHRCTVAKEELASNLNARLRWVSFVEKQMCLVDGKICAHYKKLRELDTKFNLLQQIHVSPFLYVVSLLDVNRRKKFSSAYAQVINVMWKRLQKAYAAEKRKRSSFKRLVDNHFIQSLLPYVDEDISTYGISEEAPSTFDTALREIPDFALADILPDTIKPGPEILKDPEADKGVGAIYSFTKTLREVLTAEKAEKLDGPDKDDENTGLAQDIKQFCSQRTDPNTHLDDITASQPLYPLSLFSTLFDDLMARPMANEGCRSHEEELEVLSKALCCLEPQQKVKGRSHHHPLHLAKYLSSLYYDIPKRDETLVSSSGSFHHSAKPRVGQNRANATSLVRALVLADTIVSHGARKRFCDEIRLAHLNHQASRLYQEVSSLKQFAKSSNEGFSRDLNTFHQTIPTLFSLHDRTLTQNFEALKQSLILRYENVVREYEIKIELQEAASDDAEAQRELLSLSRMTDTSEFSSSFPRRTREQLPPPKTYPGLDIPSFALKLELQAELVKTQCLARLATSQHQVADLTERLRAAEEEIKRLQLLQPPSLPLIIDDPPQGNQVAPEEPTSSQVLYSVNSHSPILEEVTEEGSYYFDDYDYGDGCEMTMIVSANDTPLQPSSKAGLDVLEAKEEEKEEDDDMGTLNFLQDTSSLLFLSSLDASNVEEVDPGSFPTVPFFPEIPYLEPVVDLTLDPSSDSKEPTQTGEHDTYATARLKEYIDILIDVASRDLITTLHYHNQDGDGAKSILLPTALTFKLFRDFGHALDTYHDYARSFKLRPTATNFANLELSLTPTTLSPNPEPVALLQALSQLGTELEETSPLDFSLIALAFIENFWRYQDYTLPKIMNTKAQSVTNGETNFNHTSLDKISCEGSWSRLDFLNLEGSRSRITRHSEIILPKGHKEGPNVYSLNKSVNETSLLETSLIMPIVVPDPCRIATISSSPTKSHNHQPKITLNNCSVGDVVLFYRDKEHRENFVAYCLDREKHFLHSDSFSSFGLDDKGGGHYNSFNSTDHVNLILGRVLSKELCLAKKYPNRFQIPLGTKFYRVRLGLLPPPPFSSPHQGSQHIVERFVAHSKIFYDKICN